MVSALFAKLRGYKMMCIGFFCLFSRLSKKSHKSVKKLDIWLFGRQKYFFGCWLDVVRCVPIGAGGDPNTHNRQGGGRCRATARGSGTTVAGRGGEERAR